MISHVNEFGLSDDITNETHATLSLEGQATHPIYGQVEYTIGTKEQLRKGSYQNKEWILITFTNGVILQIGSVHIT